MAFRNIMCAVDMSTTLLKKERNVAQKSPGAAKKAEFGQVLTPRSSNLPKNLITSFAMGLTTKR